MRCRLTVYFFVLISTIFGQEQIQKEESHLYYRHFGILDGLPSNEAYFVYQDKEGYIWICTDNGVSRFDGVEFKNYSEQDGLCSNVIFGCKEDDKGTLWMYSLTGELTKYNKTTDRFECPDFNDSLSVYMHGKVIQDLVFDKDTMYVVAPRKYVRIIPYQNGKTIFSSASATKNSIQVRILNNNASIVTSSIGDRPEGIDLNLTGTLRDNIKNIKLHGRLGPTVLSRINRDLYIFVGENLLIYQFGTKKQSTYQLPFNPTPALKISSQGLLCGSFNKGLWRIKQSPEGLHMDQFLNGKNISSAIQDQQGGIWASSQTDGLYFIPSELSADFSKEETDNSGKTSAMVSDKNTIFYLTYSGLLYGIYKDKNLFQLKLTNVNSQSPAIKGIQNNELFIQANEPLAFHLKSKKKRPVSQEELVCLSDTKEKSCAFSNQEDTLIMLTCKDGILNRETVSQKWKYGRVISKAWLDTNKLLIGTIYDLFVYDKRNGNIASIAKIDELPRFYCRYILPLSKDSVLTATSQGIFLIVGNHIVKRLTTANGLSSDKVFYMLYDKGRIWAATSKGLDLIENFFDTNATKVKFMNRLAGMPLCQTTHLAAFENFIITGTSLGIFLFDKNLVEKNEIDLHTYIKHIIINDTTTISTIPEELILNHNQNSINIRFVSLNFRNALFNKYRYRLKTTAESKWYYTSQNQVNFPQLFPGNYTFEIQALNPDGNWSINTSGFMLTINKPFWQTWQFLLMCFVCLACLTYVIFKRRVEQIRQLGNLNEKLVEAKIQALGMQLSPHFVFNALNSVSYHLAHNDAKASLTFLGKFARLMRLIFKNSQEAIIPLEEELKALRLYVELETVRLGTKFEFTIEIRSSINTEECKIPALLLQPFVENAIWHGIGPLNGGGKLNIIFAKNANTLHIEIIDNGIGREKAAKLKPKKQKGYHSLGVIKERLVLLQTHYKANVHMEITNAHDGAEFCGTKVLISIPWLTERQTI